MDAAIGVGDAQFAAESAGLQCDLEFRPKFQNIVEEDSSLPVLD